LNAQQKIIFLSSKQDELQANRNQVWNMVNLDDEVLSKLFICKSFEHDLSGRKESTDEITREWVLKSDVYLGIFDIEYSAAVEREYDIAINDKVVKKEIIILVKKYSLKKRNIVLDAFLSRVMDSRLGHSCKIYNDDADLLKKCRESLLDHAGRCIEGFMISTDFLGSKLDGARNTNFPEKLRRALLQPTGRFMISGGRKGVYEYYKYDENGVKIDVTWKSLKEEPNVSAEIKEFYRARYKKSFD